MTTAPAAAARSSAGRLDDWYLRALGIGLAGYAVFGKGFAYLGAPPFYVGEILLLLGIAVALARGAVAAALFNLPALALLTMICWTALRTLPYMHEYGIDAVRDSVVVSYGLFAFVVAALLLRDPPRLVVLVRRYEAFIPYMVFLFPLVIVLAELWPTLPNGQILFEVKTGDVATHLAGAAIFALVGFVRLKPLTMAVLLMTALVTFSQSREGLVAFVVGCALAAILMPQRAILRRLGALLAAAAAVAAVLALLNVEIALPSLRGGDIRAVSVRQIAVNAVSIFGYGDYQVDGGTEEWRKMWWRDIVNYTLHGPYFWTGKGFGINLADADGFQVIAPDSGAPLLRSPHNAHMTILARAGVPGLALWCVLIGSWLLAVGNRLGTARLAAEPVWARLFAFLLCFWVTMLVAASFDVALEGPMMGVWFWTIYGIGIAAAVLHRYEHAQAVRAYAANSGANPTVRGDR
jgi:hypothetical protein